MPNKQLSNAKNIKDDEFYTLYEDIEKELNSYIEFNHDLFRNKVVFCPCDDPEWSNFTKYFAANFDSLGLKKFISTSFAIESKNFVKEGGYQFSIEDYLTDYEKNSPQYNEKFSPKRGKIFTLEKDCNNDGKINIDDLKWEYLKGSGDFKSAEVSDIRDEADFIITNPPFSLFREFLSWILEADKQFLIVANQNTYTYSEVFPLIKENKIWAGTHAGDMSFKVPPYSSPRETRYWEDESGQKWRSMGNATWLTNIEHGKRHTKQDLMTMTDNLKYNQKLIKKFTKEYGELNYPKYDNIDAIEVPYVDAIPSDYSGYMGVPITFIDKYNPEQFEIVDALNRYTDYDFFGVNDDVQRRHSHCCNINGKAVYKRIVIKRRG